MKYNISNLDKFKEKTSNPFETMIDNIMTQQKELLESKIKELIEPYVDIESLNMLEIAGELAFKDLELEHSSNSNYDEYAIIKKTTGKKDYFTVRCSSIEAKDGIYSSGISISDVTRGI